MDSQHGRVRGVAAPVILCVVGAVCSFQRASANVQEPAGAANDVDIEFSPQPGLVWSCTVEGCTSSPNVYTANDTAAWELKATDYAESCETFDYDYDTAFPDGLYAAACSWQTDCKNPDCEAKCVANIYQDMNDQAKASPGQLDTNQDTINRDTQLAWGLTCPMIASTVYRYADKKAKGRPYLDSLQSLPAPGMACPTEDDIDRAMTEIGITHKNFQSIMGPPYNTGSDDMIAPFSYAAASEANGEPFMSYVGTVDELKALVKERCTTAVVSDALMNLAVANGVWQYSFLLEDQGYSLSALRGGVTGGTEMSEQSEPNAGLTMCRDTRGLLENLLSFAVAKPFQADKVMQAVTDLPHGQCFGVRSASQLALDVPWLSFGDARSCEEESATSLRAIHRSCSQLTTKEQCVQARFEDDQRITVGYMNAMDSEVSTADFTDACMVTFTNPWTGEVHDPQTANEAGAAAAAPASGAGMGDAVSTTADGTIDAAPTFDDEFDYGGEGDEPAGWPPGYGEDEGDEGDEPAGWQPGDVGVPEEGDEPAGWEADYGEDTTDGVYYGDEEIVYDTIETEDGIGVADESGIGEADEAGIGEADAEAIGTAAFETRSGAAARGGMCLALAAVVALCAALW